MDVKLSIIISLHFFKFYLHFRYVFDRHHSVVKILVWFLWQVQPLGNLRGRENTIKKHKIVFLKCRVQLIENNLQARRGMGQWPITLISVE